MLFRLLSALALVAAAAPTRAQTVMIPQSSIVRPEDNGIRMHTNHVVLLDPSGGLGPSPHGGGMTPSQLLSFYGVPSGQGQGVIAVVDAFDYSTALYDFNFFSNYFGLPQETGTGAVLQVVYANGKPNNNTTSSDNASSWNQEAALDIEWAHAMAPRAKIVLVEATSDDVDDLFAAVDVAASIPNIQEISMSWAGTEFSAETSYDTHLNRTGLLFFAAAGDTPATVAYPASSPYAVAVGGTHVDTDSAGAYLDEIAWPWSRTSNNKIIGAGGGSSVYEMKPVWQEWAVTGNYRGTPDISSDGDPSTGVAVYETTDGWQVFGGTSVSAPCMAGMVNATGITFTSTTQFLTTLYENYLKTSYPYRDITQGNTSTNNNPMFDAGIHWDYATGVGSPQGSASFTPYTGTTVTGQTVLDAVGHYQTSSDSTLEPTGDSAVSQNDIDYFLLQLGW